MSVRICDCRQASDVGSKADDFVVMQVANNRFDEGQLGKAKMEEVMKEGQ
jgi:hypothetical protein